MYRLGSDPCRTLGGSRKYKHSPPLGLSNSPSREQMISHKVYFHGGIEQILAKKGKKAGEISLPEACKRRRAEAFGYTPSCGFSISPRTISTGTTGEALRFLLLRNGEPFCSFTDSFEAFINKLSLETRRTTYEVVNYV